MYSPSLRPPRLLYVVTHPVTADSLLRGQLAYFRERGFEVAVIASPGPELDRVAAREQVRTIAVPMSRPIDAARDPVSLARLAFAMRAVAPDIVNASTSKAGLLGMSCARALRVPHRVYLMRGLRLETTSGALRRVLATTERIACACAHDVICNSESLRAAALAAGIGGARRARIIGNGSSNGVEPARWRRTPERIARGRELARAAGIADDERVIGFVGRFDPDKGIADLLDAFARVRARLPRVRLALVGGGFAGDRDPALERAIAGAPGVVAFPRSDDVAPFYARMDVLAFPSYREGFPNVPLEAACAELPAVGYRSTGVVDAIADGISGTIVPQGDVGALADALARYLADPELRARHGGAARLRATRDFAREVVWAAWEAHYRALLAGHASST
jgi:glycosyltransferase involved in cell wall biosynthesis